ncbi:similar to Saccharomyces cerevisiae YDR294C DPL1 Dihydrosphingosine phosphate lyase [Maudiozyma saulgeensis]|uniref:sphinganine-1-phosphate aldolase n=1 Tax=Maudiozyma saulgeensis TaxID=1789683 RepID=A0A1X7R5C3_9SACH|nr:similar to Saccharomyces cerevisiae YDR294C DPL1 Dihydrosphingosine phosphate lyase [Kazachstania saulgeensis]
MDELLDSYLDCPEMRELWQQYVIGAKTLITNLDSKTVYLHVVTYLTITPWYNILKDYLLIVFLYQFLKSGLYNVKAYGIIGYPRHILRQGSRSMVKWLLSSRLMRSTVEKEVSKARASIEHDLILNNDCLLDFPTLPKKGLREDHIIEELDILQDVLPHTDWEEGKVSGAVYHGGEDLIRLQSIAFEKYSVANQLHPDVFPAVRKMEAEVVSMTLNMFNAPIDEGACGTTTSGGTESLLLACLSAKMYGLKHHGITEPEMIVPVTAHAGFNKAAYYFGIKMHHVPVDPKTYQVDLHKMEKYINGNTVLLVGSVPNFPHGINDDVEGLGKLAQKHNLRLHIDCCLGSFIVAFMEKAGFQNVPIFDFRIPGVTSISCDTHKYGFAPKGSSIIMYRNEDLRMHQYFIEADWVGGLYGSPTLAGSRPGALVVGCWATMVKFGEDGYIESCRSIIEAARKLRRYIEEEIPALQIIGDPQFSVISFTSKKLDVYELSDRLSKSGWHLNTLQNPPALHLAVTRPSVAAIDSLCQLLSSTVQDMLNDPDAKPSADGTSALYGVAGSVKTAGVADQLIVAFLDTLYKLTPGNNNTK